MANHSVDLTGVVFGFLKVLGQADGRHFGQFLWRCQCECGKVWNVPGSSLRRGYTKSCGCKKPGMCRTANVTHGMAGRNDKAPEYRVWGEMIRRCESEKCNRYHTHGARGIKVCQRWRESFAAFIEDMGRRPAKGLTLERRNNDGDYEPGNCYWATVKQQARNKRNTTRLTVNGETKAITEWAEMMGINIMTLRKRLENGWSNEDAVHKKVRPMQRATA